MHASHFATCPINLMWIHPLIFEFYSKTRGLERTICYAYNYGESNKIGMVMKHVVAITEFVANNGEQK